MIPSQLRRLLLVAPVAALTVAASSGCVTQAAPARQPSSEMAGMLPVLSVERFLQAANARDFEAMRELFGTHAGPVEGERRPDPDGLRRAFDRAHEDRYGYSDPDARLELVTIRVAVALPGAEPRPAKWDGLGADEVRGPEVIALPGSTLVIPAGWRARAEDDVVAMLVKAGAKE